MAALPRQEPASGPRLQLIDRPADPDFGTLVVTGLSFKARQRLAMVPAADRLWDEIVRVTTGAGPAPPEQPSTLGSTTLEGDVLRFRPRFSLVVGLEHFARFDGALLNEPACELSFALLARELEPRTRVVSVDPDLQQVPANLLRIYVTFSGPMHARDVQAHIQLLDAQGRRVREPFVDIPDGLWDREQRRLTLFFDPGRIKRGVGPNEALGPPLQPGKEYRLLVDADLEDARGARLVAPFLWSFRTIADDRTSPDPDTWTLIAPRCALAPVELLFGEPLDRALLERLIYVEDGSGTALQGEARVTEGGGRWAWTPAGGWQRGDHVLVIHPALEDLAGNAVGHLFEERLTDDVHPGRAGSARLPFRVEHAGP